MLIKDNAFGHDAKIVAEESLKIGATYLAVSCLFEALDLERQGISKPIFILYDRFEDELETCIEHNWTLQIQFIPKELGQMKITAYLTKKLSFRNRKYKPSLPKRRSKNQFESRFWVGRKRQKKENT